MKKFIPLLFIFIANVLNASAPSTPKTVIAQATIEDYHTSYSIKLANGFVYQIKDGKKVLPIKPANEWSDGICYQKPAKPNLDLATATRLLYGRVRMKAAEKLKLTEDEHKRHVTSKTLYTSQWRVFEDETVEQVS